MAPVGLDRWMARRAAAQHGVLAWFQLRDVGVTRGVVDARLASGHLQIVHRGVYAVGHARLAREGRWMAGVLAFGPDAVLSHRPAAMVWGVLAPNDHVWAHVTVPRKGGRPKRQGIVLHRSRVIEREVVDGIPVTSLVSTLCDLAATQDRRTVEQAVEGAERLGVDLADVRAGVSARSGAILLRDILAAYDDAPTRSELERLFLKLCAEYRISRPLVNVWVAGFEVDFLWPDARLVVETDGHRYHGTRLARGRDLEKEAALALAGYRTERFGWRQVTEQRETVARVLSALTAPTTRGPSSPGRR